MKIILFISSLSSGGAERVLAEIAYGLSRNDHTVTVITLSDKNSDFYSLPKDANRISLRKSDLHSGFIFSIIKNIRSVQELRYQVNIIHPDIIISFMGVNNVRVLLSCFGKKIPVVITEHNYLDIVGFPYLWGIMKKLLYRRSSYLVSVSKGVSNCFPWLLETKRRVIYNPLPLYSLSRSHTDENLAKYIRPNRYRLVGMGRLIGQKGFDRLVSAFAKNKDEYSCWDLIIMGEGGLRSSLESQAKELGVSDRVFLPGVIPDPFPVLNKCHIFVLSSRFEGFGNVLVEAMSCGLPVISFDCPAGPSEIINNGVDGILIPNGHIDKLASAMAELMDDADERKRLGANAIRVRERFSSDVIIQQWEELIDEVVAES